MRGFLFAAGAAVVGFLAILGIIAAVAIAIVMLNHNDATPQPSPFGVQPTFGPAYPVCPPGVPCCPGGKCPATGSIEVGEPRSGDVNTRALQEPKGGGCPTCPNAKPAATPAVKPASKSTEPVIAKPVVGVVDTRDLPREGRFTCRRCKQLKVGEEWEELWADDDTSLMCLCHSCWSQITPAERAQHLQSYVNESMPHASKSFYVRSAIAEVSRK